LLLPACSCSSSSLCSLLSCAFSVCHRPFLFFPNFALHVASVLPREGGGGNTPRSVLFLPLLLSCIWLCGFMSFIIYLFKF
jgi:hypothetical protein